MPRRARSWSSTASRRSCPRDHRGPRRRGGRARRPARLAGLVAGSRAGVAPGGRDAHGAARSTVERRHLRPQRRCGLPGPQPPGDRPPRPADRHHLPDPAVPRAVRLRPGRVLRLAVPHRDRAGRRDVRPGDSAVRPLDRCRRHGAADLPPGLRRHGHPPGLRAHDLLAAAPGHPVDGTLHSRSRAARGGGQAGTQRLGLVVPRRRPRLRLGLPRARAGRVRLPGRAVGAADVAASAAPLAPGRRHDAGGSGLRAGAQRGRPWRRVDPAQGRQRARLPDRRPDADGRAAALPARGGGVPPDDRRSHDARPHLPGRPPAAPPRQLAHAGLVRLDVAGAQPLLRPARPGLHPGQRVADALLGAGAAVSQPGRGSGGRGSAHVRAPPVAALPVRRTRADRSRGRRGAPCLDRTDPGRHRPQRPGRPVERAAGLPDRVRRRGRPHRGQQPGLTGPGHLRPRATGR